MSKKSNTCKKVCKKNHLLKLSSQKLICVGVVLLDLIVSGLVT